MADNTYRALVVDDEVMVRNLTLRGLVREGFSCDAAADGLQAKQMIESNHYDVVVTDLRMPNGHGHALATELLLLKDRPIVVVLTGVLEPRIARDLIGRGADYVEFKPVNYDLFAAKVSAFVRRRREHPEKETAHSRETDAGSDEAFVTQWDDGKQHDSGLEASKIEGKLAHLSKILPVSQAAFDVFSMTGSDTSEVPQIAAAVARDASLTVDVLRLANSAFYNTTDKKIVELEEAVVRVGQKRVGELALATSALGALTSNVLPWMNADLTWHRSVAAGVAIDLLLAQAGDLEGADGLFLSAIMHPLGRLALGMLYPQQYQRMVKFCAERNETLEAQEQQAFPLTHGQVMGRLLKAWNIPEAIYEPLEYVANTYSSLAGLPNPLRTKVELLKLAVLIGWIAVGEWESWDRVEFPPAPVLRRFGSNSFSEILQETKSDSQAILSFRPQASTRKGKVEDSKKPKPPSHQLTYLNLSPEFFDFLGEMVSSMGIGLKECQADAVELDEKVLVNCVWSPPYELLARIRPHSTDETMLIVTDATDLETYGRFGRVLPLPASYGALRLACDELAQDLQSKIPIQTISSEALT